MIAIIDYGLGNISAFVNVYKRLDIPVVVAKTPDDLAYATKLILPGVGAFDYAMKLLQMSGFRQTLDHLVLNQKIPVLGICVGMQILANSSDEGILSGLGFIPGHVRAFKAMPKTAEIPLPHMGWNDITGVQGIKLLDGLESGARFYFLHSYCFECADQKSVAATTSYGIDFCSVAQLDNVYGVQFHPEKSHHFGANLLKNFANL